MSLYLSGWQYEYHGGHYDRDLFTDGGLGGLSRSPTMTLKIEVQSDSAIEAERFQEFLKLLIGNPESMAARPKLLDAVIMLQQLSEEDFAATITSMGVKLGSRGKVGSGG